MDRFTAHWGITACPSYFPSQKEGWETQCPSSLPDKYSLRINLYKTHSIGMECEKACCHRGSEPWVSGRLMPGRLAGMHGSGSENRGQSCIWEREEGSMKPAGQWGHSLVNRENATSPALLFCCCCIPSERQSKASWHPWTSGIYSQDQFLLRQCWSNCIAMSHTLCLWAPLDTKVLLLHQARAPASSIPTYFLIYFFNFMCMSFYLHICMCTVCSRCLERSKLVNWIPWNWSYR